MLDNYPDNEILGTVIDSIQGELEKKAEKSEIPEVPVQDVQINGTSVLQDGVANVPLMSSTTFGVAKSLNNYGVTIVSGFLQTYKAPSSEIKAGTGGYKPIVAENQHESTFYGLAKAAGDTT